VTASEEAPDKIMHQDKDLSCLVLTGELFKLHVGISAQGERSTVIYNDAALDTCGGCNLSRRNQVPPGAEVRALNECPRVASAEGQSVKLEGVVTLEVNISSTSFIVPAEFLVVDKLVVPILLGTPWISDHVLSINPVEKTVVLRREQEDPVEFRLEANHSSSSTVLRVHTPRVIPAFSESWVTVRTHRTGLASLRPTQT
jgi:hypothetical protein